LERLARAPAECYRIVKYDDLVSDPEGTVTGIYAHFGWEMDCGFARVLRSEASRASRFRSRHRYAPESLGLSAERIIAEFHDVFERFDFPLPDGAERTNPAKAGSRRRRKGATASATKRSLLG
jgi:hypothetical protein